jgi:5-methylcytosine-specific restriction endonuclease McrBC regulatory subunit McrC
MPRLFEQYVAAVFSKAYRQDFECSKSRLTFPLDAVDKDIELDGVLRHRGLCLVIESKYKILGEEDEDVDSFDLSGARIRSHDLYQALAYATHIELRAQVVILIYPSWLSARSPVCVFDPITKLGWRPEGREGIPIFLVALDLSQPFNSVVDAMKQATGKIVDSLAA